jgi:hypothetical protein
MGFQPMQDAGWKPAIRKNAKAGFETRDTKKCKSGF